MMMAQPICESTLSAMLLPKTSGAAASRMPKATKPSGIDPRVALVEPVKRAMALSPRAFRAGRAA